MKKLLKKSLTDYKKHQKSLVKLRMLSDRIRIQAKQAIALLRRENTGEAKAALTETEKLIREAGALIKEHSHLGKEGVYRDALEEYVEARVFYSHVTRGLYIIPVFMNMGPEEILGGICDFTGELVRKAISEASIENRDEIEGYKKTINQVIIELTKIGFQGKLRKKYDDVERNLQKIEGILYDIRIKQK